MSSPARMLSPIALTAAKSTRSKKRALADSDAEQRDAKRTKSQADLPEDELKKETKDKKKRRKKKRKISVVLAQDTVNADVRVAPQASGSRSRSRSMTLAVSPGPNTHQEDTINGNTTLAGPSDSVARVSSPSLSSSSKGKGRAILVSEVAQASQQQITDLEDQVSSKNNLVSKHEDLLSSFQHSLSCQICLDLMHKPYALSPCGHSACHQCLVNWFQAPPPDIPPQDLPPVWMRTKTCPHCRAAVRERPTLIWTIKDMVATLVKSGLAQALLPPAPPAEEGPANADPWQGIFRPIVRNPGVFPDGHPPALMQQVMGLRDDEDGGIYRCIDCHHEIEDGVCSQCGRVYPGHDPLGHDLDEFDGDLVGHWGDPGIWDDSIDEDDDSLADGFGDGGVQLPLDMLRRLFGLPAGDEGLHDDDSDSSYSVESRHYDEPIDFAAELPVFRPAGPHLIEREDADGEDEEGYESSFIDDDGDERPRRHRAPSVDLDRDSVIDLSEADEQPDEDDGEDAEVQFVGFGRRRGGSARARAAIVISEDEDEGDSHEAGSAAEDSASGEDEDLAAEVAAREYDMYGDDGSVPRRGRRYEVFDDVSGGDSEGSDDGYRY